MIKKDKFKKIFALSLLSGCFLISSNSAIAMMKPGGPKVGGATSSGMSSGASGASSSLGGKVRLSASGNPVGPTYSQYAAEKGKIKNDTVMVENRLSQLESQGKYGIFKVHEGGEIKVRVHKGRSSDGLPTETIVVDRKDRTVSNNGDGIYSLTLDSDGIRDLYRRESDKTFTGIDMIGHEKLIVRINGNNEVVYQPDLGILREVRLGRDGKIYLGSKVELDSLSPSDQTIFKNTMREIGDKYANKVSRNK